jgi:hypothetical protein
MPRIVLKEVRLSFPDVFTAVQYQGQGPFNYRTLALLEKGDENCKKISKVLQDVCKEKWADKAPTIYKQIMANPKQCFYSDGDLKDFNGAEGHMIVSASRALKDGPPKVVGRDGKTVLTESSVLIYSGVYANISIDVWAQDNKFGKGLRAGLVAVQFVKHGESFGGAAAATSDDFEDIGFDDEAFDDEALDDEFDSAPKASKSSPARSNAETGFDDDF